MSGDLGGEVAVDQLRWSHDSSSVRFKDDGRIVATMLQPVAASFGRRTAGRSHRRSKSPSYGSCRGQDRIFHIVREQKADASLMP